MTKKAVQAKKEIDKTESTVTTAPSKATTTKTPRIRKYVQAAVFTLIIVGLITGIGSGSLCSIGYESIAAVCPLGALESFFGSGTFVARTLIALIVAGVIVLLVGKAFCSWVCPVKPLRSFLSSSKRRDLDKKQRLAAAQQVSEQLDTCTTCRSCKPELSSSKPITNDNEVAFSAHETESRKASVKASGKKRRFAKIDARHVVLGGSLVSAAACGFPVFCLICPVGLTFASAIALYRLIGFSEPTLDLIVFPLIIFVELVFLRNWCHRFCPISALMSLVANFNKTTRPKVDSTKCLRTNGTPCITCSAACSEFIDPVEDAGKRALAECTRCGQCIQACPTNALFFTKKGLRHGK